MCPHCRLRMGGYTCPIRQYEISGATYERVPFTQFEGTNSCNDCGIAYGNLHHPRCDLEECPRCHEQAIACDCVQVPVPIG